MKHLLIVTSIVLVAALLAKCTKDKNDIIQNKDGVKTTQSITSNSTQKNSGAMPAIAYQLTTVPMNVNSPLQWTSGYMENSALAFDAIMVNDARFKVNYVTNTGTTVKLFGQPDIDKVSVPPARYEFMTFTLNLLPGADPSEQKEAFVLYGSFLAGNMMMPVELKIDQPIDFAAQWQEGVNLGNDSLYRANLVLSLPVLSAGVTAQMMNEATSINGLITISVSSNSAIYQKILGNVKNALTVQFGTKSAEGDKGLADPGNTTYRVISGGSSGGNSRSAIAVGK